MRSTGIVRRIDELGRVVIPKEIRRTMRLKEGEELEVFTTEDALVLKKFSAVKEMVDFNSDYVKSIYLSTGLTALITDKEKILAVSGDIKQYKVGLCYSAKGERLLEERRTKTLNGIEVKSLFGEDIDGVNGMVISPIISNGDVMGAVIVVSKRMLNELSIKTAETAACFLAKRL